MEFFMELRLEKKPEKTSSFECATAADFLNRTTRVPACKFETVTLTVYVT